MTTGVIGQALCTTCHKVSGCDVEILLHGILTPGILCAACDNKHTVFLCYGYQFVQTPEQTQMRKDKGYGGA